jgi:hypothetical protein
MDITLDLAELRYTAKYFTLAVIPAGSQQIFFLTDIRFIARQIAR